MTVQALVFSCLRLIAWLSTCSLLCFVAAVSGPTHITHSFCPAHCRNRMVGCKGCHNHWQAAVTPSTGGKAAVTLPTHASQYRCCAVSCWLGCSAMSARMLRSMCSTHTHTQLCTHFVVCGLCVTRITRHVAAMVLFWWCCSACMVKHLLWPAAPHCVAKCESVIGECERRHQIQGGCTTHRGECPATSAQSQLTSVGSAAAPRQQAADGILQGLNVSLPRRPQSFKQTSCLVLW